MRILQYDPKGMTQVVFFDFINVKQLGINIFIIIVYSLIFVVLTNFISKKKRVLL